MSIELPQPRMPQTAVPKLIDWGADLTPPMGGPSQRLNRIGDRFALVINYPRLKPEPDARILMARVRRAKREGALFPFPQPGLEIGNPGTPVVNGAGQQGSSLQLRGFTAGYVVREGQFFSIIFAGRRYLHCASADVTATASGTMLLPIHPMLRISPNSGATCEFAQPYIEGTLGESEASVEWAIARASPSALTIMEAA
ncbi:hypothetical protein SAMN05192583_0893 [Sphingomonas gellani]|uniref:Uncharacterized protein n=1 Tax=Sphingomonas gellani TaxID=1166340 RepID=A0A1H7ZWX9_9SPHN|nr:hypothetical protein [Sphingomonas gellani]SEM62980.1 hypothetical protein SAMN05192583_0893 [Sphingomonas gellani]